MNALAAALGFLGGFALGVALMNSHWRVISESNARLADHWRREHDKQRERAELSEARIEYPR